MIHNLILRVLSALSLFLLTTFGIHAHELFISQSKEKIQTIAYNYPPVHHKTLFSNNHIWVCEKNFTANHKSKTCLTKDGQNAWSDIATAQLIEQKSHDYFFVKTSQGRQLFVYFK